MNKKIKEKFVINGFELKLIAIVTMLIDHIGAILFPELTWMRYVGRISFPIFAFLLVEGYAHTKNVKLYLRRLLLFAFASEPFYDLAFHGKLIYLQKQNIFFTLFFALLILVIMDKCKDRIVDIIILAIAFIISEYLGFDYGFLGILTVLIFSYYKKNKIVGSLLFSALHIIGWGLLSIQSFAVFALLPIFLYDGNRGRNIKYLFYMFYPVHLFVLILVNYFL